MAITSFYVRGLALFPGLLPRADKGTGQVFLASRRRSRVVFSLFLPLIYLKPKPERGWRFAALGLRNLLPLEQITCRPQGIVEIPYNINVVWIQWMVPTVDAELPKIKPSSMNAMNGLRFTHWAGQSNPYNVAGIENNSFLFGHVLFTFPRTNLDPYDYAAVPV